MKRIVLLFAIALITPAIYPQDTSPSSPIKKGPTISRITIRGTDIFDTDLSPKLRKFPYTWINFLHIQTKEEVIRHELLFKVGDKYDPFLTQETERNLRALSFIRAARISKYPQRDGTMVLVVHVNDAWTTEPQLNLGGTNSIDETEVGFREKNLFGFGKRVEFLYSQGDDFDRREYKYSDPQLFGTRYKFNSELTNETDGRSRGLSLEKPFYSADTKWAMRGAHEHSVYNIEQFDNNKKVSEYERTQELSDMGASLKLGSGRNVVTHGGLRYQRDARWFEKTNQTNPLYSVPETRILQTIFFDFDAARINFIETTHLEKMTRIEDVNLGPSFQMSPGLSPKKLTGSTDSAVLNANYEQRFLFNEINLLENRLSYSGRDTFKTGENEVFELNFKYYHRPTNRYTTVVRTRINWANDLDQDNAILLGGNNGLRSQEDDRFVGNKSWVMNVENRFFFIDELWNLVAVGGVVFADSGYAWPKGHPVSMSDVRTDMGAGLRFGLTRSSNEVIVRFDFAYRMQVDENDSDRWVFTFGSGQAF